MVKAMGKNWHPECFNCHKCHKTLSPDNFMEKSGKPYCVEDYHKLFSPKCSECNLPIKEKVISMDSLKAENYIIYFNCLINSQ